MFTIPEGSEITAEVIKKAIEYNDTLKERYDKMERYYLGDHDILSRTKVTMLKNNKVVINHAKYITDVNVGYLLGNPVEYQTEEDFDIDALLDEYRKQSISDLDHEIAKDVSIFGRQYEYIYADENAEVRSKDVDVRNCVLIYDDSIEHNKLAGVIYQRKEPETTETSNKGGIPTQIADTKESFERVLLVTDTTITEYASGGKIVKGEETKHYFGSVPIVDYKNNSEFLGDFEVVIPLIDAYNILQSDRINDKEQLVEAVLALYGFDLTKDQLTSLKQNRVLSNLPLDSKAEYLVKSLSESDTDVLRQVIEQDIHKISMTPNMSDENFVGNSSGVAIRYKLLGFEQSVSNKERYFETGLLERFELYNNFLETKGKMSLVPKYQVDVVFKRNLPQNDYETSQMMVNLDPFVDRETLVGQLSFVKDASEVVEQKEKEDEEKSNEEVPQFGLETPEAVAPVEETEEETIPTIAEYE